MTQNPLKLSVRTLKSLEARAKALGLNERLLIENASSNFAHEIVSLRLGKKVLIVAGKGNNGADSLACGRKLLAKGFRVCAALVSETAFSQEVNFQKEILRALNVPLVYIKDQNCNMLLRYLRACDFVIDGLLGIGARGEVSPLLRTVIKHINRSGRRIISCDIPSGLSPDEGTILGEAIRADYTITFLAYKQGFFTRVGRSVCGKVSVVDIGVSAQLLKRYGTPKCSHTSKV